MTHAYTTDTGRGGAIGARLAVMMFLQFFVWGAWFVTLSVFMSAQSAAFAAQGQTGLSDAWKNAIPTAYSMIPIAAIVSPFFLGMIADRFFATERVLGAMHLLGGLTLLAAPSVAESAGVNAFVGILLIHALFYMPTLGLTNTLALHNVTDGEKQFPLIRVFGTIGWIVANVVISLGLHADQSATQFYVAGAAGIAMGLYSFSLPHTPPPAAGKQVTARDVLGLDSLALLKKPSFAVFIICSFLICIPLAAYYSYAGVFVGEVKPFLQLTNPGAVADPQSTENVAFVMSFGQMSEIFFMLVMPLFFARLGVKYMLLVGMLAWVARYALFTGSATTSNPWMVLVGIILHGICYDFFFVTGQIYVDKKAPNAIRGQAQGFLVLVTQGLGMLIGAQVIGAVVAANTEGTAMDWRAIWMVPCIAAAVIAGLFFALFRDDSRAAEADELSGADTPVQHAPVT